VENKYKLKKEIERKIRDINLKKKVRGRL